MSTQTPGLGVQPPHGDACPALHFPTSTPSSQGGAAHGNAHPNAPCALSLGVPLPSFPSSGHLFIYLSIYLFIYWYLLTTGSRGGVVSAAQWGAAGSPPPPTQPPAFWGAAGSTSGEGCLWVPTLPSPFCQGEESHWCLQGGHWCLPSSCRSSEPPRSLPCPSLFIDLASWHFSVQLPLDLLFPVPGAGGRSQDV